MPRAPTRLRCEYLENPVGIDVARPRLSWWLDDERAAEIQTAYQIQAASSQAQLASGEADLWDSGHVYSRHTTNIEYQGRPLGSGALVWWRVRSYDSDGMASPWSEPGHFELGLLQQAEWRGQWIGGQLSGGPATSVPAVLLTRDFSLSQPVFQARLYVAVLGAAVVEVNGQCVTERLLAPGWHDYRKRVTYQVLDVTAHLQPGANRVGAMLGDGFYCGALGAGRRQQFGDRPWLLAQLVMRFPGGESRLVVSDDAWQWRPSWVLRADPFLGESIDGRQRLADWSLPGSAEPWYPVACNSELAPRLCADLAFPVRLGQVREPTGPPLRRADASGRARLVYDFGVNMVARLRLGLRASRGADVRIRYAQTVEPNGELLETPGAPISQDHYAASGAEPEERFESVFGLHGFRYVEVSGPLDREAIVEIVAVEVVTGAPPAGRFACDHALLNGLHDNVQRNLRHTLLQQPLAGFSALHRVALVEDGRALAGTAACLLDAAPAFRSWLRDLVDAQQENGGLPPVVPPFVELPAPATATVVLPMAVGAATLLACAWGLYRHYGDRRSLEFAYPTLQRSLAGLRAARPELILDCAEPAGEPETAMLDAAWYCYALTLAARIAGVLGRLPDLEAFEELRLRVRAAFRRRFVTPDGLLAGDNQLAYLLSLYLGLLEGAERSRALQRVEDQLRRAAFHAGVDYRDGALLLEVLTLTGRAETAYELLLQTSAPSWLHPVRDGATSSVDEVTGEPSRSAAGSVVEWLYRSVAGLELDPDLTPDQNAYRSVRIRPRPPISMAVAGGLPLTRVAASLDTVNGRYESAWDLDDRMFRLRVSVPCNGSARVVMPDGAIHEVVAGRHEFVMPLQRVDQAEDGIPVLRDISEAH